MFGLAKKEDLFEVLYGRGSPSGRSTPKQGSAAPATRSLPWDGEKYRGGYGATDLLWTDYWTLRARSAELFKRNLYARGLIRRLITNELNTGLHLEATPEESVLGFEEDGLADWSEKVEIRFYLWGKDPFACDHIELRSFGALQAMARLEALVDGDVLVVNRQDARTGLPRVQLISGSAVQTPFGVTAQRGNRIEHGVELDAFGRQVAYWVRQTDGTTKRLPAFGEKSGRRLAWLVYGVDKRLDDVRGEPLLALVLQSLKEIDRYRDSTQRKAVINSMLAMFIKKDVDKPGSRPFTAGGGAIRRDNDTAIDSTGAERSFRVAEHIPGLVIDELQAGEEPEAFQTNGTVENFGAFEEAVIQAVAWANEVPPEIMRLSFSSNYSASQAAINEFKAYLNRVRTSFGENFCGPIFQEWLLSEALNRRVDAPGLLEAWRDPAQYDIYGAWVASDWSGNIKPAVDQSKLVKGYKEMVAEGFITRDRAARELTGTKYSKNAQKLRRENEQLAAANAPIVELEAKAKPAPAPAPNVPKAPEGDEPGDGADEEEERLPN
jgi:lambda family phage portal protein